MPVMKREEWLKLSPRDKVAHRLERNIDRLNDLKARYDRGRANGSITKSIPFLES